MVMRHVTERQSLQLFRFSFLTPSVHLSSPVTPCPSEQMYHFICSLHYSLRITPEVRVNVKPQTCHVRPQLKWHGWRGLFWRFARICDTNEPTHFPVSAQLENHNDPDELVGLAALCGSLTYQTRQTNRKFTRPTQTVIKERRWGGGGVPTPHKKNRTTGRAADWY